MSALWDLLHPEIRKASEKIAETGAFDVAIFEAFKLVEDSIQARIGSNSIGQTLLNEAFGSNPPKIDISSVAKDQNGIKSLFSGAFEFIRNDRGHKKNPTIPCDSEATCLLYLNFASLLLEFLDKDRSTFPKITEVRIYGTPESPQAELRGNNFSASSVVMAGNDPLPVIQVTPNTIDLTLPSGFKGELEVVNGVKKSSPFFCNTTYFEDLPETWSLVIETQVKLFSDGNCRNLRAHVVGLLLRCSQSGGHEFQQIWPVRPDSSIRRGDYVQPTEFERNSVDQTWYIAPGTTQVEDAWLSALIVTPTTIGRESAFTTGSISILPNDVRLEPGERRTLRVFALG